MEKRMRGWGGGATELLALIINAVTHLPLFERESAASLQLSTYLRLTVTSLCLYSIV